MGDIRILNEHYRTTKIQAIDVIQDWSLDFATGNVVKYLQRCPHKGKEREDTIKALWYLAFAVTGDGKYADRVIKEADEINGKAE
jgi:hypothetical protein